MLTLAEVKAKNKANGQCWFSPDTMRFFRTKIHGGVRRGKYFITSEDNFDRSKRLFSVRTFDEQGNIDTVGAFQGYQSLQDAIDALREVA